MWIGTGPLPGIVARVACHTNFRAVAQAKSFTVSATKCHTSRPSALPRAVACPGPISSGADDRRDRRRARAPSRSRSRAVGVSTSSGFCSTPGAAHDPAGRHVDAHVEAAEVVVELRRAEVQLGVPAAQVVVHGDARKPLRGLEQRVGPALRHAVAAPPGPPGSLWFHSMSSVTVAPGATGAPARTRATVDFGRRAAAGCAGAPVGAARPRGRRVQVDLGAVHRQPRDHHPLGVLGRHRARRARHRADEVLWSSRSPISVERVGTVVVDHHRLARP